MLLIGISCAWILGIWIGSLFNIPAVLITSTILPIPFLLIFKRQRKNLALLILSLLFFFAGTWLSPIMNNNNNSIAAYNSLSKVEFSGIVSQPPENKNNQYQIVISVKSINGHPVQGKAIYNDYSISALKYGDVIKGQGLFQDPPIFTEFNYRSYLAGEGIYSILKDLNYSITERNAGSPFMDFIFNLREQLSDSLARVLPEPQASLCQGIVLGVRNNISQDFNYDLSVTGTTHLLAISGQNLTIIAGLLLSLGLFFFGRRYYIYVWLTLIIIWFYSVLTGLQAPVIRSAIMASIFLLAEILGRQKYSFPALMFSAGIMAALSPNVLGNLSFQLSFMAMTGLIFITPIFTNLGRKAVYAGLGEEGLGSKVFTTVTDSFSVSLGAVIAVWPIIAFNFNIVSFIGPLTTFLMSPALTPIILFGTLTAFIGLFSPPISQVIGWITWLFLSYMILVATIFAALPGIYIKNKPFNIIFVWLYYSLYLLFISTKSLFKQANIKKVLVTLMYWGDSLGERISIKAIWIIPPLLIVAMLTLLAAVTMPDHNLQVSFLNVGEGDSILIQSNRQNVLIDGGPSGQAVCLELGKKMPFSDRKFDLVILTHPHLDHLTGLLEILKRYSVKKVLISSLTSDLPAYQEFMKIMKEKNIKSITAQTGQQIQFNNGAVLDILSTSNIDSIGDPDQNAIVARLSLGLHSLLLTSDIGSETETRLLHERLVKRTDILKIAHHGSKTSTTDKFLQVVNPSAVVISVGANNQFGHPDTEVLNRIKTSGIKTIFRTDLNGTICFNINDAAIRVSTER